MYTEATGAVVLQTFGSDQRWWAVPRFDQAWVQLGHQNHNAPGAGAAKGGPGVVRFLGSRGWSGAEGRLVVQGVRARERSETNWVDTSRSRLTDTKVSWNPCKDASKAGGVRMGWSARKPLESFACGMTECDCEPEAEILWLMRRVVTRWRWPLHLDPYEHSKHKKENKYMKTNNDQKSLTAVALRHSLNHHLYSGLAKNPVPQRLMATDNAPFLIMWYEDPVPDKKQTSFNSHYWFASVYLWFSRYLLWPKLWKIIFHLDILPVNLSSSHSVTKWAFGFLWYFPDRTLLPNKDVHIDAFCQRAQWKREVPDFLNTEERKKNYCGRVDLKSHHFEKSKFFSFLFVDRCQHVLSYNLENHHYEHIDTF